VRGSYRELSRGIECGLARLGAAAQTADRHAAADLRRPDLPTACFAHASRGDMVSHGRKIVGSAQTRRGGVILQHGSIPLRLNLGDLAAILRDSTSRREQDLLRRDAGGIVDAVGREVSREELAEALVLGFQEAFPGQWREGELTPAERSDAERLAREKYGSDEWTFRPVPRQGEASAAG
jgi:lipoate-protein ligase A